MKFLANENFMIAGVRVLRNAGLDVASIGEDFPSIKDREVLEIAISTHRTILTHDRDYGELVFKHGYRPEKGVVYFRMKDYLPEEPPVYFWNCWPMNISSLKAHFVYLDLSGNSIPEEEIEALRRERPGWTING